MTDTEQTGTDPTGEQTTDVNADDHDVDPGRAAREATPRPRRGRQEGPQRRRELPPPTTGGRGRTRRARR